MIDYESYLVKHNVIREVQLDTELPISGSGLEGILHKKGLPQDGCSPELLRLLCFWHRPGLYPAPQFAGLGHALHGNEVGSQSVVNAFVPGHLVHSVESGCHLGV